MPPPPTPFTLLKKKRVKAIVDVLRKTPSTGLCAVPADGSWMVESVKGLYVLDRVPEFLSSLLSWVPPSPPLQASVSPLGPKWGDTLACRGGYGGTQFRRLEQKLWYIIPLRWRDG
jgi:hypothetical protein